MIKIGPKTNFCKDKKQNNINLSFGMNYEISRLPNVNDSFVKTIENSLKSLPDKWGDLLRKKNYKLYCANSIKEVFDKKGLPIEDAPDWDAVTCAHPWLKFFVFTPKVEPQDAQKVVNHEISHGIVDIEKIMQNNEFNNAIVIDAYSHNDYSYKSEGLWNVENLLCRHLDYYSKNEIFVDSLAWLQPGGGLWGSGYKNSLKNPNFIKEKFPTVYKKISEYEVGIEKEPILKTEGYNSYSDEGPPF